MVKYIDETCDFFFNYLNFGAHNKPLNFQLFLLFLNVVLSAWPLTCYMLYSTDIHIVFWLGELPQYVNLAVPLSLCCLNLGLNFFQCFVSRAKNARIGCFSLFMALGVGLLVVGMYVGAVAEQKAKEIEDECGSVGPSVALEQQWQKVDSFYNACDVQRKRPVTACANYGLVFPDRIYLEYLEQLEYDFECTGMCKFWARPVFNQASKESMRCATEISRHIREVEMMVASPTAFLGLGLITIGVCLSGYDHL